MMCKLVFCKNRLTVNFYFSKIVSFNVVRQTTASVVYWSEFLATDPDVRDLFLALPDFLSSSGFGTGSTQPREYN
jgi:hypothetical protein